MSDEPQVLKARLLAMQVCVPEKYTDDQVIAFAESQNPAGTRRDNPKTLLLSAAGYLCASNPEQGDYCKCGAYVGAGEKHKSGCLFVRIMRYVHGSR